MYPPSEDSHLLAKEVTIILKKIKNKQIKILDTKKIFLKSDFRGDQESKNNRNFRILDMGTGSGIQALTCRNLGFDNIVCADIDTQAINQAKNLGFKSIKSNLFSKIKTKFDLIIFNPPYLPQDKYDKEKDTSGGKLGDETILRFLKNVKNHLNNQGKILLLISSLTLRKRINSLIKKLNFKIKVLSSQNLFFEKLEVWLIWA